MSPSEPLVVVGAGAAGLMAAATLAEDAPQVRTMILSDRAIGNSNSVMAQGGLHVPYGSAESRESMVDDMLRAGGNPGLRSRVTDYVGRIAATIETLESWGLALDRSDGELVRRRAGGMSESRIVGTADSIGPAVLKVLKARLADSVIERPSTPVSDLGSTPNGVAVRGPFGTITAAAAIVATGGTARQRASLDRLTTTNPPNQNHVLYRELSTKLDRVDPDLFQYQPFGLVDLGDPDSASRIGYAVPETIVEYPEVQLIDRSGCPIADLQAGRLAITRAIHAAVSEGRGVAGRDGHTQGATLTLSRIDPSRLVAAFPNLCRRLERAGLLGHDVVVEPFLHYQLGGLVSENDGSTTIKGVFLAGEIRGGLHGQNRLMGNGLTESLVSGRVAAQAVLRFVQSAKGAPQ